LLPDSTAAMTLGFCPGERHFQARSRGASGRAVEWAGGEGHRVTAPRDRPTPRVSERLRLCAPGRANVLTAERSTRHGESAAFYPLEQQREPQLLGQAALVKAPSSIRALFSLPGFVAQAQLAGVFGDRYARVIRLRRRKKLRDAGSAVGAAGAGTTSGPAVLATSRWPGGESTCSSSGGGSTARGAAACT
jgi:hypothetical protein